MGLTPRGRAGVELRVISRLSEGSRRTEQALLQGGM